MRRAKEIMKKSAYAALCLLISAVGITQGYLCYIMSGRYTNRFTAAVVMIAVLAAILYKTHFSIKKGGIFALVLIVACFLINYAVFLPGKTEALPDTKKELFEGKTVLLLSPHQDDELNLLGGVIEEYRNYDSDVWVVFSTNGDYKESVAEERIGEAEKALAALGVPHDRIILLGYGDNWEAGHIYQYAEDPDKVLKSFSGKDSTYGLGRIPAYRENRKYTYSNFKSDLKSVILELEADIIYCVDYDLHPDHRALSLMFERVMGEILRETEYRPVIMKGFAYSTAWYSREDFFENVNLTQTVYPTEYMSENNIYFWKDRVRLPINHESITRKGYNSRLFRSISSYETQRGIVYAEKIVNSDKVFWEREAGSLCCDAKITVSSGNGALLNDFMLVESRDILQLGLPLDGIWVPVQGDQEQRAQMKFKERTDLNRIVLYDNPSLEDNILSFCIEFDDGTTYEGSKLLPNGSGTEIIIEKENVGGFAVTLKDTEGKNAGLSEIEAFSAEKESPFRFIKIIDANENFVYDYIQYEAEASYDIYACGIKDSLKEESYTIVCDNNQCSAEISEGKIKLHCPKGQTCLVTVTHKESGLSDSVRIRHYGKIEESLMTWQKNMILFFRNNIIKQEYTNLNLVEQKYLALLTKVIGAYIQTP